MTLPMLSVHDLSVAFDTPEGKVRAVEGVSFHLEEGETLALVGESGSGKTMTALAILRLVPYPGSIGSGRVFFMERNILRASEGEMRALRGNRLSMIFQDPMTSLNPLLTIGRQLSEVLETHMGKRPREARKRAKELRRSNGRYGLATQCIGAGMGISTILERID